MTQPNQAEPNTATTDLPYGDTPDTLRLDIVRRAKRAQDIYTGLTVTDDTLTTQQKILRSAAMHASGYGWSIAALLGWLKKEHGEAAMWSAAAIVQDMLTNGDSGWCDDLPEDIQTVTEPAAEVKA